MTTSAAFSFDARFCSGCKACQVACKDKNHLPAGVLWRRVIEVSGGGWQKNEAAWNNTVFAYHLSISCNHCAYPKCAGVCPTKAYTILDNGIVFLDTTKCVGCGYCAWACPYGAPQYDPEAGHMTKCDLCLDNLEAGLPPSCVAACPLRVLDYGEVSSARGLTLWNISPDRHPFPLPSDSHTEPRLAIQPHKAMQSMDAKTVANLEEIRPRRRSTWEDGPLIVFTLLAQLAVGCFWSMLWTFPGLWVAKNPVVTISLLLPLLVIGLFLGAGTLASLAHLGTKRNAWQTLANLRKSWLSREILFTLLFGLGWLVTTGEIVFLHRATIETLAVTAALGFGLVYAMSQVYRLRTISSWNRPSTNLGFVVTALLLGESFMINLAVYDAEIAKTYSSSAGWMVIGLSLLIFLLIEIRLMKERQTAGPHLIVRTGLLLMGVMLTVGLSLLPGFHRLGMTSAIFLILLLEEAVGRWTFYHFRTGSVLSS